MAAAALLALLAIAIATGGTIAQDNSTAGKDKSGDNSAKPKIVVGKSLPGQLRGYWSPDVDALIKLSMGEVEKSGIADDAVKTKMKAMMAQMFANMVFEFTKDKATFHIPNQESQSKNYKILSTDPATGELKLEITDENGKVEKGTAVIKGKTLTLKDGNKNQGGVGIMSDGMIFNRITEAEFKKRVAANKKLDPKELLKNLLQEEPKPEEPKPEEPDAK